MMYLFLAENTDKAESMNWPEAIVLVAFFGLFALLFWLMLR